MWYLLFYISLGYKVQNALVSVPELKEFDNCLHNCLQLEYFIH